MYDIYPTQPIKTQPIYTQLFYICKLSKYLITSKMIKIPIKMKKKKKKPPNDQWVNLGKFVKYPISDPIKLNLIGSNWISTHLSIY